MAEGPQGAREVAELLGRHGVRPDRRLGQHFLVDPNIVRKVVGLVEAPPGSPVLEVGAGTGTLTRALAEAGYRVRAYEVDERLEPVLGESLGGLEVDLRFEDALQADLPCSLEGGPWTMASNLPYQVGTLLLLDLLREAPQVERFVVMVQREVAERVASPPGGKDYGIPSVVAQLFAEVEVAFRVSPNVFLPRPEVESAVVVLERRAAPPAADRAAELAAVAFGQRRKMLRSSLGELIGEPALEAAGLDPTARPEQIPPEGWVRLAEAAPPGRPIW